MARKVADTGGGIAIPARRHALVWAAIMAGSLLPPALSRAGNVSWTASQTTWNSTASWDTAVIPTSGTDTAVFNAAGLNAGQVTTLDTATMSVLGLLFQSTGTVAITNGTGGPLTLGTGGITVNSGAGADTISANVTLNGAQSWTNSSSSLLTVSGNVNNGANLLTIAGSGNTSISGVVGNGSGGLTMNGTGTLTLSASNTYTGATTINAGTISINSTAAISGTVNLNNGTLAITVAGLFPNKTFNVMSGGGTITAPLTGTITDYSGANITGSGPLTLSGWYSLLPLTPYSYSGTLIIASASHFEINQAGLGAITNLVWGASSGSGGYMGWWGDFNTGVNITFQGGVSGTNYTNGVEAFAFSGALVGPGGFTNWADSRYSSMTLSGTADNTNFTLTTFGPTTLAKTSGPAVHAIGGTLTISGGDTVTLAGTGDYQIADTATVTFGSSSSMLDLKGNNVRLDNVAGTGKITNSLASSTGTVYWGVNNGTVTYSGNIQNGTGSVALTKVGTGSLTLTGSNNYTGATNIQAGTLKLGGNNLVPTSTTITMGSAATNGTLDLFGYSQQLAGLAVAPGATAASQLVTNSRTGVTSTLTFAGGASTFGGAINNGAGTTAFKVSSGTLTLNGTSNFTGGTTITAGTLQLGDGTTNGSITGSVANSSNLVFANGSAQTFAGSITGTGTLLKQSAGMLTLTATGNTYSGGTTLAGGTLVAANASGSATGSGALTVGAGATLAGNGTINAAAHAVTINGALAPHLGTALTTTLNVTTSTGMTFNSGMNLNYAFGNTGVSDLLNITGPLTVTLNAPHQGTLSFNQVPASAYAAGSSYTLVTASSGISGFVPAFWDVGGALPSGLAGVVSQSGNSLILTLSTAPVPVTWYGQTNLTWDTSTTNWKNTSDHTTPNTFTNGAPVVFDANGAGNSTITVAAGGVSPASAAFSNTSAVTYALSGGAISGAASFLSVNGGGTVSLNSANTYAGGTTVSNASTLNLGDPSAAGAAGAVVALNGNAKLDLMTNSSVNAYTITVGGPATIVSDRASAGAGVTHTLGSLTIGSTTLTISGGTSVNAGTAALAFGAATLSGAPTFSITNPAAGGTTLLTLGAVTNGTNTITLTGNGNFAQTGAIAGGAGGLTLDANFTGTATLSQANLYTGGTVIQNGKLAFAGTNALSTSTIVILGSAISSGTLDLAGFNEQLGGLSVTTGASAATQVVGNSSTANASILTFSGSTANTFAGILQDTLGSGNRTVAVTVASGTQTLSGANNYSGATTVTGGQLTAGNISAFGTSALQLNGGTLDLATNASIKPYNATVGGSATIISDRATPGAGIIQALGALSIGSNTLSVTSGANVTSGSPALAFGTTTLTGNAILNPTTASLTLASVTGANTGLTLQGSATANSVGAITTGSGTVSCNGGTWTFSGANTYTGATSLTGGTVNITGTLGNSAIALSGGTLNLQNAGAVSQNTLTISSTATLAETVANAISGSASLAINSTGTVTLALANNYAGTTTVNSGTLLVNAALNNTSAVSVKSGATLGGNGIISGPVTISSNAPGGILSPHTAGTGTAALTVSSAFVLGTGSILNFNFSAPGTNDMVTGITGLTLSGTSTLNVGNQAGFAPGVYELFGYTGLLSGSAANITLGATPNAFPYTYTIQDPASGAPAGEIVLNVALKPTQTWTAHATKTWNTSDANWTTGAGNVAFVAALPTVFDDTVTGANAIVTITGTVNPFQVTVNTNNSYTLQGTGSIADSASGPATLIKNGTGILTITNSNAFTGGTTINAGVLAISNATALGSAAVPLTLSAGTLEITATFSSARPITLGNAGPMTLSVDDPVTYTHTGIISGLGVLNVNTNTSGTLILAANNTFTGGIVLSGTGTLSVSTLAAAGTAQPLGQAAHPLTLSTGSTLNYTGSSTATNIPLVMGAGGSTINISTAGNTLTLSGLISGGSLAITGGTAILSGPNTFTGSLTIGNGTAGSGTVTVGTLAAVSANTINLNGGTFAVSANLLTTGKTFNILPGGGTLIGASAEIQLDGTTNITGIGPLTVIGTNHFSMQPTAAYGYSGTLTIGAGSRFELNQNGLGAITNLIWAASSSSGAYGGFWGNFNTAVNITFQGGNAGEMWTNGAPQTFIFSGTLTGASANSGLTSWGNGNYASLALSGASDNTNFALVTHGATTLAKTSSPTVHAIGGTLTISGGDTVTIAGTGDYQLADTATLLFSTTSSVLNLNGNNVRLDTVSGTGTFTNNLAGSTGTIYWGANNGTTSFFGNIQNGAGTTALAKIGTGTLILTASAASNNYTGATAVQAGTLKIGVSNSLPIGTVVTLGSASTNGTLDLNGFNQQIAGLALAPGATAAGQAITNTSAGISTLTYAGGNSTYAGALTDSGGVYNLALTLNSGTLTLTGTTNNYSGVTTLVGGTLIAGNASGSATGSSAVTLNGGTLASAASGGSISGAVSAGFGAHTIAPGGAGSIGIMNLGSTLALNGNTTLTFDVNGSSADLLNITGALSITTGTPTLNLALTALTGNNYTLATFASAAGITPSSFNVTGSALSGYTLVVDSLGLRLVAPSAVTWTAATNTTWDTTSVNWNPSPNTYASFKKVVFDDTSTLHTIVIPGTVTPFSVHVTTSGSYRFTGAGGISGMTSLLKDGPGMLIFTTNNNYTGGTTITAGSLQLGDGLSNGSITGAVTDNATLAFANPSAQTFAGTINGNGALVKQAAGTLVLTAPGNYAGATTIAAGALSLAGAQATSGITVNNFSKLISGGSLSVPTASLGTTGTDTTSLDVTIGTGLHPFTITASGGLATHGSVIINTSGNLLAIAEYPLIEYTGSLGGDGAAAFTLGTLPPRIIGNLDTGTPGKVQLNVTALDYPKWTGSVAGGTWDINSTTNWQTIVTLATTTYLESSVPGDSVIFDDSAPGTRLVNLSATLHPASVLVNNTTAGGDYTFAGPGKISGTAALTKQGTGKLTLGTTNDYTGGTYVQNGTLAAGITNALPVAGTITIGSPGNSATFDLNGFNQTVAGLATAGTAAGQTITNNGAADALLTLAGGNTTFGGVIADGTTHKTLLSLVSGTLTLGSPSNYTGGTSISGGTLALSASNALPAAGSITLLAGTFDLGSHAQTITAGAVSFQGGALQNGIFTNNSVTPYDAESGTASATLSGTAALNKTTAGTFSLAGAANYTGGTNIKNGTLQLAVDNALPLAGIVTLGDAATSAKLDLNGHAATVGGLATAGTAANQVITNTSTTAAGTLTYAGGASTFGGALNDGLARATALNVASGSLTLTGSGSFSGGTTLSGGVLNVNADTSLGASTAPITFAGGTLQAGASSVAINSSRPISINAAATAVIDARANAMILGGISGIGSLGLTKTGTGTLTITTPSSYAGTTLIASGTVKLGAVASGVLSNAVVNVDATTITGNPAAVTSIANLGTGGGTFINNGASITGSNAAPAYSATAINGHPALVFNGGMSLGTQNAYVNQTNTISIFMVQNQTSGRFSSYPGELSFAGPGGASNDWNTPGNLAIEDNYTGDEIRSFTGNNVLGAASTRPALNTPLVWGTVIDTSSNPTSYADMATAGGLTTTNGTAAGNVPFRINEVLIGGRFTGGSSNGNWNGQIGQVLIFNAFLSPQDRIAVEAYLATKWSLATPVAFLPAATPVQIAAGASLDLNGYNQQIGSLADSAGSGGLMTNSAPGSAATLILATSGATTFSGHIQDGLGAVALTINGSGTQVLAGSNTYTGATSLLSGTLTLSAAGAISNSTITYTGGMLVETVDNAISGAASLILNGPSLTLTHANSFVGGTTVSNGNLLIANLSAIGSGGLTQTGGTTQIQAGLTSPAAALVFPHLTLTGGTFDLTNNRILIRSATDVSSTIRDAVLHSQLTTSTTTAPVSGLATTVGYLAGSDYITLHGSSSFGGTTITTNDIVARWTYAGDINLDGIIDIRDFRLMDSGYVGGYDDVARIAAWKNGDVNHDGIVNAADFALAVANIHGTTLGELMYTQYANEFGSPFTQAFDAAVPEPATLTLLALGAMSLLRRRLPRPVG